MKKIINKIKKFLIIIINFFKTILIFLFKCIFSIFPNKEKKKKLTPTKTTRAKETSTNDSKTTPTSDHHDETPPDLILNKDSGFSTSEEDIEKIILKIFCKELELEEKDLTRKENEYLKNLNAKLTYIIEKDVEKKYITNNEKLSNELNKLVIKELEIQYNLEQNNKISAEKIFIIPLLIDRKNISIKNQSYNGPTFLKVKAKELNIESNLDINDFNLNNTEITPPKDNKDSHNTNSFNNNNSNNREEKSKDLNINNINNKSEKSSTSYLKNENESKSNLGNDNEDLDNAKSNDNSSEISDEYKSDLENDTEIFDDNYTSKLNESLIASSVHIKTMEQALKSLSEPLDTEKIDNTLDDTSIENTPEKKVEIIENTEIENNKNTENLENYDFTNFDALLEKVNEIYKEELKKEELEDKNYELLENLIQDLLEKVEKLKLKNLNPLAKGKLLAKEKELTDLRDNMENQKQNDINNESALLRESILIEDLEALEVELQKLHLEENIELQKYMLNSLEDLDTISEEKAKLIERELLKLRLKKTLNYLEISSLLALPFIHNKYFLFFTCGLFANRHLKLFNAILNRKTLDFDPEEIGHIKNGANALQDALSISNQNIEYLNYLENEAFRKHPELKTDLSYLDSLNKLKAKLLQNQEKLLKKEKMVQKHNLKLSKKVRKLKKHEHKKAS